MQLIVSEQWKSINGFEGKYEVSNQGRVRTVERTVPHGLTGTQFVPSRIRKLRQNIGNGYIECPLKTGSPDRRTKFVYVHRTVIEAFTGPSPASDSQVNHKDGNKRNNCIDNLEWSTPLENTRHAISNGLTNNCGEMNSMARLNKSQVLEIVSLKGKLSSSQIGRLYGVTSSAVLAIFRGKNWSRVTGITTA